MSDLHPFGCISTDMHPFHRSSYVFCACPFDSVANSINSADNSLPPELRAIESKYKLNYLINRAFSFSLSWRVLERPLAPSRSSQIIMYSTDESQSPTVDPFDSTPVPGSIPLSTDHSWIRVLGIQKSSEGSNHIIIFGTVWILLSLFEVN